MNSGVMSEITIEEMAEDIELLIFEKGIECFKITETTKNRGKYSYLVRNLHIETEDKFVCFYDYDGIIEENIFFIIGFFTNDNVLKIVKNVVDGVPNGELYFNDGDKILIEIIQD